MSGHQEDQGQDSPEDSPNLYSKGITGETSDQMNDLLVSKQPKDESSSNVPYETLQLEQKLKQVGLEKDWLDVLKKKFNITSAVQLRYLKRKDMIELQKHTNHNWEKEALKELIQGNASDEMLADFNTHDSAIVSFRDEQDKKRRELEDFSKRGHIDDKDWVSKPNDTDVNSIINSLSSSTASSVSRKDLETIEVIQNASGGKALMGIYYSKYDMEEIVDKSKTVIRVKTNITLKTPTMSQHDETLVFSSREKLDKFHRSMRTIGVSFDGALKLGSAFKMGLSTSIRKDKTVTDEQHSEQIFHSRVKCAYVPVKSCELKVENLFLDKDSLAHLQQIEAEMNAKNSGSLHTKCLNFFNNYGSHVNVGIIHFGGIYLWNACYEGSKDSKKSFSSDLLEVALGAYISCNKPFFKTLCGGKISGSALFKNDQLSGQYDESEISKVQLTISKYGGPPEADEFTDWKHGLTLNNSTWHLIDRGNFEGVWTILQNHASDFIDHEKLAKIMEATWRLEVVKESLSCQREKNAVISLLKDLSYVSEVMCEIMGGRNSFTDMLQDNRLFGALFVDAIDLIDSVTEIKPLLQKILSFVSNINFHKKKRILTWIGDTQKDSFQDHGLLTSRKIQTVDTLTSILENDVISFMREKCMNHDKYEVETFITHQLTTVCLHLLPNLKSKNVFHYAMFLSHLTILKYNAVKDTFDKLLAINDLDEFIQALKSHESMYKQTNCNYDYHQQICVIYCIIDNINQCGNETSEFVFNTCISTLHSKLHPDIQLVVQRFLKDKSHNWQHYLKELDQMKMGNNILRIEYGLPIDEILAQNSSKIKLNPTEISEPDTDLVAFLQKFGLDQYFPGKLTLIDAITIHNIHKEQGIICIPRLVLNNILMVNRDCRDRTIFNYLDGFISARKKQLENVFKATTDSVEETYEDDDSSDSDSDEVDDQDHVNPLDILLSLFYCGSYMLQQVMASKLFSCGIAFPLILPPFKEQNPHVLLGTLHSIVLDNTYQNEILSIPSADIPCHVVSFIRIGTPSFSKSGMLNKVLSYQDSHAFFDRVCPLGTTTRKISNGLVESSIIPPSEIADQEAFSFRDMILLLNLRGDACDCPENRKVLTELSTVVVVAVTSECLKEENTKAMLLSIHRSDRNIIIALDLNKGTKTEKVSSRLFRDFKKEIPIVNIVTKGRQNDWAKVQREFYKLLSQNMNKPMQTVKERFHNITNVTLCIDENNLNIADRSDAEEVVSNLHSISDMKSAVLPLQTKIKDIATLSKKLRSSSEINSVHHSQTKRQLSQIREDQLNLGCKLSPFMISFIRNTVLRLENVKEHELTTFVILLKTYLDRHKRSHTDYERRESSIGFEHIMREIAQIFESFKELDNLTSSNTISLVNQLPSFAKSCLMIGQPIELMDGENGYIPITWMEAVFENLRTVLGDKKTCLVISVIGVQSSGKSTLLNTMFGLNFPVGAGHCTDGVFMQIVPVVDKPFDYILVLDTEGLRAPSRENMYKFDNELATFAIGIADIFIVNIKGEASHDIKDVMGMVITSLLRLKSGNANINLNKKCIFVHQNVGSNHALEKTQKDREKFMNYLDEITEAAASDLKNRNFKKFNDVISFDLVKNNFYLPDLVCGNYPMQYTSNAYSSNVLKLKTFILEEMCSSKRGYFNFFYVYLKLKTIWEGILSDDHIFHFQNPLSMRAYDIMHGQMLSLTRSLHSFGERLLIDKSDFLRTCGNMKENADAEKLKFQKEMEKEFKTNIEEFDKFVENHSLQDYMYGWHDSMKRLLSSEQTCKIKDLMNSFDYQLQRNKNQEKQSKQRADFESKMSKTALNLSKEDMDINDEVLEERFNEIWQEYNVALLLQMSAEKVNVEETIENVVNNNCAEKDKTFITEYRKNPKNTNTENLSQLEGSISYKDINTDLHISIESKNTLFGKMQIKPQCITQAVNIANNIFLKIDRYLQTNICEETNLEERFVTSSINTIDSAINSFRSEEFSLLPSFHAMLIFHVQNYLTHFFLNRDKNREEKVYQYRDKSKRLFRELVIGWKNNTVVCNYFLDSVATGVTEYVSTVLPIEIKDFVLRQFEMSKCRLITAILKDLATKNVFDSFKMYIDEPQDYALGWIVNYTNNSLFSTSEENGLSKYGSLAERHVKRVFDIIKKSIFVILKRSEEQLESNPRSWIDNYIAEMGNSFISLLKEENVLFLREHVKNVQTFSKDVLERLDEVEEMIIKKFNETNSKNVEWKQCPYSKLMETLWGCQEHCPFCNETCKHANSKHLELDLDHECWQHRPQGIGDIATSCHYLYFYRWKELVSACCNELLETDEQYTIPCSNNLRKYKDYKKDYPHWTINPLGNTSKYWMWVFNTHKEDIQRLNKDVSIPKLPATWNITKQAAIESLKTYEL